MSACLYALRPLCRCSSPQPGAGGSAAAERGLAAVRLRGLLAVSPGGPAVGVLPGSAECGRSGLRRRRTAAGAHTSAPRAALGEGPGLSRRRRRNWGGSWSPAAGEAVRVCVRCRPPSCGSRRGLRLGALPASAAADGAGHLALELLRCACARLFEECRLGSLCRRQSLQRQAQQ